MDGEVFYATPQRAVKPYTLQNITRTSTNEFTAPENDDIKKTLDLNEQLIGNKATTYFMRVSGEAMTGAGIFDGDLVIVDRSLTVANGKVIIAVLNGEMLIRRFEKIYNKIRLLPDTAKLSPIDVDPSGADFSIWGVVTYVIHVP